MTGQARNVMSRRRLLQSVGTAAGTFALAGCSNMAARWGFSGNPDTGRVHLTYALWDAYQQIGYQKSIDEFTKKHPHITVTILQIPYNNFAPKLTSSYISGNAPDVFWVNTPFLANWIDQGIVSDLTDRVTTADIDLSIYYPQLVELHRRNGKLYGLPKDWDTICCYYNKTLFTKLGVQPPTEELTWSPDGSGTFVDLLRKITVDERGRTADQPGFDPRSIKTYAIGVTNDPQSGYGSYLPDNGGAFIEKSYAPRTSLNTPANRETMSFLSDFLPSEHLQIPYGELGPNADGSTAQTLFAQGRTALYQAGDWNTSAISELTGEFEVGTFRLPRGPQGNFSVFNGLCDGMNTDTPHPDEAWQLIEWLAGERSQAIMGSGGYIWPAIKKLDPLYQQYWAKKKLDVQAFLDAAHDKTTLYPVSVGMAEIVQDVATELGPMFYGTRSVAESLAAAQQVADYRIASGA